MYHIICTSESQKNAIRFRADSSLINIKKKILN